ncbi:MAG: putative 3-ketoacyl-acyl carrier protein reductase, fabG, partial [Chlamydiia bacterium]|nr:putative 3-ketoacyl-acyl carrier protein reductase, fabG [Chlamydiia bacterium]
MKWTLVTGGAKRLGAEICRTLARSGHSLAIHYNSSETEAKAVAEECRKYDVSAEVIQGDFSTFESTKDFIIRYQKRFVETENLINNVGNYLVRKAKESEMADSYALFQTNVHAPHFLSLNLIQEGGAIINMGVCGLHSSRADVRAPLYTASKMALWSLTKSLARELAPQGISVNMVSPGQLENSIDLPADCSTLPMKRPGKLSEVTRVVAFLLDKENRYITGQ